MWSVVRRFDEPQKYKPFVSRCTVIGDPEIGSLREVNVKSGLPATTSTERLELLDEDEHILGIKIIGGDHRLKVEQIFSSHNMYRLCLEENEGSEIKCLCLFAQNYSSIVTVHPEIIEGRPGTMVIESFVVDVPQGNTKDETCYFVEALIRCNLKSLAHVSERLASQDNITSFST